jgi:NAD(P)-dependent dehydrogenase (short-subunit alcohol dehydrogenase family)
MSPFSADLLKGRVAVITGGSAGIGREIARAMLAHGAQVAIASRQPDNLDTAASLLAEQTGRVPLAVPCDIRDTAAVDSLVERVRAEFGTPDIVVNNAAANFRMDADRMTLRAFRTVVDVDLIGTFNVTRAVIGGMLAQGSGCVLSIVVPDAPRGFPHYSHAGAAKAGIVSLTASWSREWGPRGIRVNAIAPGPIATEGATANVFGGGSLLPQVTERVPLGRLGATSDVANAALYLCSEAAGWVPGVTLPVDGGLGTAIA